MSEQFGESPSEYRKIWSSLEIERLINFYNMGLSNKQIGFELGRNRNQVSSKVHRLILASAIQARPRGSITREVQASDYVSVNTPLTSEVALPTELSLLSAKSLAKE